MGDRVNAAIGEKKLISIVRAKDSAQLLDVIEALAEGGIPLVESSMTTPDAAEVIRKAAARFGDRVIIGAGTVLSEPAAERVIDAGARFVLSPVLNRGVVGLCRRLGISVVPGCFTPTEMLDAVEAGADFVKVFPTSQVGPGYIKAVKAPLPHLELIAVGGVELTNAAEFIDAGCVAVGVGSSLVKSAFLESGDMEGLRKLAAEFVAAVGSGR